MPCPSTPQVLFVTVDRQQQDVLFEFRVCNSLNHTYNPKNKPSLDFHSSWSHTETNFTSRNRIPARSATCKKKSFLQPLNWFASPSLAVFSQGKPGSSHSSDTYSNKATTLKLAISWELEKNDDGHHGFPKKMHWLLVKLTGWELTKKASSCGRIDGHNLRSLVCKTLPDNVGTGVSCPVSSWNERSTLQFQYLKVERNERDKKGSVPFIMLVSGCMWLC